jgi:hypothetical protein
MKPAYLEKRKEVRNIEILLPVSIVIHQFKRGEVKK